MSTTAPSSPASDLRFPVPSASRDELAALAPPLTVHESLPRRILFGTLLVTIAALYFAALLAHWYPANPGVDQNGYLVGGKLIATTGTYGFIPKNPFSFVGAMWNLGPDGKTYYPKYPLGLPWIYATLIHLFGTTRGTYACHLVSPVCATLSVIGVYLLARPYVGGFGAVLTALLLALSPVTFGLANNPNSHATTLACVTLGIAALLSFWRHGTYWRAALAGFLLGYALTVRYTEGLLLLPMGVVAVLRLAAAGQGRKLNATFQGLALFAFWCLPVGTLLAFNLHYFGSPTGYDSTKESTGFSWDYFVANWDLMLRELDDKALALVFPLSLVGLALMTALRRGWQLALILASWIFPAILLYTAYYWAPDSASLGYARFILTVLPGLSFAAVWLVIRASRQLADHQQTIRHRILGPCLMGGVFALALANMASANAETNIPESRANALVNLAATNLLRLSPNKAVVFAEPRTLHHLQFVTDCDTYAPDLFSRVAVLRLENTARNDEPNPLQPQRAKALYELLKDKTDGQLIAEQNHIMDEAFAAHQRVFFVLPLSQATTYRRRFLSDRKYNVTVAHQWQEPPDLRANRWQRAGGNAPVWASRRNLVPSASAGVTWQILEVTPKPPSSPPTTQALLAETAAKFLTQLTPATPPRKSERREQNRTAAATQRTKPPTRPTR